MEKKKKLPKSRALKYAAVGISTFIFDLALLVVFNSLLQWNYIVSAGVAFIIAVSVNYLLSRKFVFTDTSRPAHSGYFIFIAIALVGLTVVTLSMALLVGDFHIPILISRIIIAGFIGIWNYLANFYFNFKVEAHI